MYGFAYGVMEENSMLVRPLGEEELVVVFGTKAQVEIIGAALREQQTSGKAEPGVSPRRKVRTR